MYSWCSVANASLTRRANGSSENLASAKPIEKVLTGAALSDAIVATTTLESMPPLRNAPSGTSLIMRPRTASRSDARSCSDHSASLSGGWLPSKASAQSQ